MSDKNKINLNEKRKVLSISLILMSHQEVAEVHLMAKFHPKHSAGIYRDMH